MNNMLLISSGLESVRDSIGRAPQYGKDGFHTTAGNPVNPCLLGNILQVHRSAAAASGKQGNKALTSEIKMRYTLGR